MKTPPPLSPELEAALAPHRTVLRLSPAVEARAMARAAAATESLESYAVVRAPHRPQWVFAMAAGLVLALGAAAYAARGWVGLSSSPPPAHVAPSAAPRAATPRPPAAVPAMPEPEAPATIAPAAAPHAKRSAGRTTVAAGIPTNEELHLLRAARQDVTRGDFARALAVIGEHARRFRNGSLVEEREALRVKALAGLGRRDDAKRAAAQFRARFPHSVFLSTFDRMKGAER